MIWLRCDHSRLVRLLLDDALPNASGEVLVPELGVALCVLLPGANGSAVISPWCATAPVFTLYPTVDNPPHLSPYVGGDVERSVGALGNPDRPLDGVLR